MREVGASCGGMGAGSDVEREGVAFRGEGVRGTRGIGAVEGCNHLEVAPEVVCPPEADERQQAEPRARAAHAVRLPRHRCSGPAVEDHRRRRQAERDEADEEDEAVGYDEGAPPRGERAEHLGSRLAVVVCARPGEAS